MRRALWTVLLLPFLLAACGETWTGVKKDTGENVAATGRVIEKAGEKVEGAGQAVKP